MLWRSAFVAVLMACVLVAQPDEPAPTVDPVDGVVL